MNLGLLKLADGDLYCSEYRQEEDYYLLTNPLHLVMTEKGPVLIDMFKMFTDEDVVKVRADVVMYVLTPSVKMTEAYNKSFSKIVTPSKSIIL